MITLSNYIKRGLPSIRKVHQIDANNSIYSLKGILKSASLQLFHYREFHQSNPILFGRKTGSKALDPKPREMSKKQKKRRAETAKIASEKKDHAKEKLKANMHKKRYQTEEVKNFAEKADLSLSKLFQALNLPGSFNYLDDLKTLENEPVEPVKLVDATKILQDLFQLKRQTESQLLQEKKLLKNSDHLTLELNDDIEIIKDQNLNNLAIRQFAQQGNHISANDMLGLMDYLNIPIEVDSYTCLINMYTKLHKYDSAESLFNKLSAHPTLQPDINTWNAIIICKAERGDPDEAIKVIDSVLRRAGIRPTIEMLSSILKSYVILGKFKVAEDLWQRMHLEGLDINLESFHSMLVLCSKTHKAERALFYMDELRALKLVPTLETFEFLFKAVSKAPHWVNGYHDIIFDVMSQLEGEELVPNIKIYNSILFAFGKAGDATAAEFYFWEMIRKGIKPNLESFDMLFRAYAINNSVGVRNRGFRGRYTRPLERKLTKDEKTLADLGPDRANAFLSQNFTNDGPIERGSRQMSKLEDLTEEDPEILESVYNEMEFNAKRVRATRFAKEIRSLKQSDNLTRKSDTSKKSILSVGNIPQSLKQGKTQNADMDWESSGEIENFTLDSNMINAIESSRLSKIDEYLDKAEVPRRGRRKPFPTRRSRSTVSNDANDDVDTDVKSISEESITKPSDSEQEFPMPELESEEVVADESVDAQNKYYQIDKLYLEKTMKMKPISGKDILNEDVEDDEPRNNRDLFNDRYPVDPNLRKCQYIMRLSEEFTDPFYGNIVTTSRSSLGEAAAKEKKYLEENLLRILDEPTMLLSKSKSAALVEKDKNNQIGSLAENSWDLIEFGRAPDADYSLGVEFTRRLYSHRAKVAFKYMLSQNLAPDTLTMNGYFQVFTEALMSKEAIKTLQSFKNYKGVSANSETYDNLIRMYLRTKDLDSALDAKSYALEHGIQLSSVTHGRIIHTYTGKNDVVNALKELEQAASLKVSIPEYYITHLRGKLNKLGVTHPDMPQSPKEWVKGMKQTRKNTKNMRRSKIQDLNSVIF